MRIRLFVLLLCCVAGATAQEAKSTNKNVELTLTPAPAPSPVLKYLFQPKLEELIPGNALPAYLKCFMEQDNLFANKEVNEERTKYMQMSLEELKPFLKSPTARNPFKVEPKEPGMRLFVPIKNYGGIVIRNARYASKLESIDWGIIPQIQQDGYYTLLPEIQRLRALSDVVSLHTRGEILDGNFPEAIADVSVLFNLAKNLGEHPTYIGTLVGIAIGHHGLDRVEEIISQPKAPNLYWALSMLPHPLVRQEKAVISELGMHRIGLKHLLQPTTIWRAPEIQQAKEFIAIVGSLDRFSPSERVEIEGWLKSLRTDEEWLKKARLEIASPDRPAELIDQYQAEQVIFLSLLKVAEVHHQESVKFAMLPFHQAYEFEKALQKKGKIVPEEVAKYAFIGWIGLPRAAQAKFELRLALLRGVEAVRLYAANHEGKLPESLASTGLPVPIDPATGGAIRYEVKDGRAILRGTPPKGEENDPRWNLSYTVILRK